MEIGKIAGSRMLLAVIGISGGALVAGGVVALMIGLGIVRRFAGITHTAAQVKLYETAICLGGIWGNFLTLFSVKVPVGSLGLLLMGIFFGIFVGGWIMALAEMLNVFPVYSRRLGLTKGSSWIVISLAFGKMVGSLLDFWMHT